MTNLTRRSALAATLLSAALAVPASAAFITYDLTGTWAGKVTCKELAGGVKLKTVATPVMKITQSGLNFGVQLDFGTLQSFYGGLANPDVKKPEQKGEATLLRCGTTDVIGGGAEIVRLKVSTKADKGKGSLSGQSFFAVPNPTVSDHGTCKWKWKRTDTIDPGIPTECTSMLQAPTAAWRGGAR